GVQDPRQALLGEPDAALDRRERDVHHRRVQHDHELRRGHEHQDRARIDARSRTGGGEGFSHGHHSSQLRLGPGESASPEEGDSGTINDMSRSGKGRADSAFTTLTAAQQRAWLAYMRVQLRLTYEMNRQLQADSNLSLPDYDVLNALRYAPGGR